MPEARRPAAKAGEELTAITRAYDLVREMTRRVGKLPRDARFVLGDRILRNAYDVLDLLIAAKYRREKVNLLDEANLRLEQLRFQIRLAHDEAWMSHREFGLAAASVDEVGRLIGGWRRAVAERAREGGG